MSAIQNSIASSHSLTFMSIFTTGSKELITWLNPIIHILFTLSATLAEGVGLAFSPGKVIFTGIQVLLSVAKDVVASHDALVILFERVKYFIERVKVYAGTPLTDDLTNILGKIMGQVLSILALSTKEMTQRRIKAFGRTDVENALQRLDMLTQEETRMAVANNLAVTHDVNDNVKVVKEATHDVNKNVKAIKEITGIVDGSVKVIKEFTRNVDDNSREKLRKWLSSPDPSTNHNIARDAHHNGTAAWFTEGTTFKQWKTTGSLLWIYGKRTDCCHFYSAIIQDLEAEQGIGTRSTLTAYFYFDFKDIQKQDVRSLLSSLLIQLSDQSDESCAVLSQLYSTHRDGSREPSEGALAQCLKDMINIPHQSPIYIIVDAIDECPNTRGTPSAREKVLHLVEDLVSSHSSNLYLCVTSRPEHDIRTVLEPLTSCRFSLHDEFGQKDDIVKYVTWFVHSDLSMRRWRAEDKELVIKTLSEKADGM
ncbi:hypothetical protein B0F90DRAFT_1755988 [Multifurca ochricompacta]|uniref:NACHT domain-containing protein n=1 Tax=Multifurca ochricompacta TaxID=376703 RepID=A0AAD4QKK3_9AGAM|nr:hypothetical protein B0F90DRAFT_1755988 [Multifurca ochricompacta]